ncbi:MAG: hypothetical protein AB3N20_05800 [Rhizobiaceae bacterium]
MSVLLSEFLVQQPRSGGRKGNDRPFAGVGDIKQAIAKSKNYALDGTDPEEASALLFFQTRVQQTWLVRTAKRLYCILDDVRKPAPHINWSTAIGDLVNANDGSLKIEIGERNRAKSSQSIGYLDIGDNHKGWLYSKKLFASEAVVPRVERFISQG